MLHIHSNLPVQSHDNSQSETNLILEKISSLQPSDWPTVIEAINSGNAQDRLIAVMGVRHILYTFPQDITAEMVAESKVVSTLLWILNWDKTSEIQIESAWSIIKIASGTAEFVKIVVDAGGVPCISKLDAASHETLSIPAILALGNIAKQCIEYRNLVIENQGFDVMVNAAINLKSLTYAYDVIWSLGRLCRFEPPYNEKFLFQAAYVFFQYIQKIENSGASIDISDALWSLVSISKYVSLLEVFAFQSTNIIEYFLNFLLKYVKNIEYFEPALAILNNIASFETATEFLKTKNCIEILVNILKNMDGNPQKPKFVWFISHLTAGSKHDIQHFLKNGHIVTSLIQMALFDTSSKVQIESLRALVNLTYLADYNQILTLFNSELLSAFMKFLEVEDDECIILALKGISNFLACEQNIGKCDFKEWVTLNGTALDVERLLNHPNEEINQIIDEILETFFDNGDSNSTY